MKPIKNYDYIFIIGPTGSGKSTMAEYLVDTFRHMEYIKKIYR